MDSTEAYLKTKMAFCTNFNADGEVLQPNSQPLTGRAGDHGHGVRRMSADHVVQTSAMGHVGRRLSADHVGQRSRDRVVHRNDFFRNSSADVVKYSTDHEMVLPTRFKFMRRLSGLGQRLASAITNPEESTSLSGDADNEEPGEFDQQQCFGNKHVGFSIHKFGKERAAEGNWEEAVLAWQNALEILKEEYGEINSGTIKLLRKIGFGYLKLGNPESARDSFAEAVRITKEIGLERNEELEFALKELTKVLSHKVRSDLRPGAISSKVEKVEHDNLFLSCGDSVFPSH